MARQHARLSIYLIFQIAIRLYARMVNFIAIQALQPGLDRASPPQLDGSVPAMDSGIDKNEHSGLQFGPQNPAHGRVNNAHKPFSSEEAMRTGLS